jgi:hypothetical protein
VPRAPYDAYCTNQKKNKLNSCRGGGDLREDGGENPKVVDGEKRLVATSQPVTTKRARITIDWLAVAGLAEPPVQCRASRPRPSGRRLPARRGTLHHSWSSVVWHAHDSLLTPSKEEEDWRKASLSELLVLDTPEETGKSD